jgi:hypothetical protein
VLPTVLPTERVSANGAPAGWLEQASAIGARLFSPLSHQEVAGSSPASSIKKSLQIGIERVSLVPRLVAFYQLACSPWLCGEGGEKGAGPALRFA